MPKSPKPLIYIICGPTATGKSDYAVKLAKEIGGEIISADSRQVYKGFDITSGKITKKEMRGVPHFLLDVASPKKTFSANQYKKLAQKKIEEIIMRNHTPIICGGTGFYIDVLIALELPDVPPNKKLRKELEKKTLEELQKILKKLDPKRYATIDQKNKVRLIRSIEITHNLGKVPKIKKTLQYNIVWIGLDCKDETLKERIYIRLQKRIKAGMITEVKKLHESGLSWKRLEQFGLEYKYCALYLQKKLNKKEMLAELEKAIWHYAKRQRTWFKRNKNIQWIVA